MTLTAVRTPAGAAITPDGLMAVSARPGPLVYLYTLDPNRLLNLARERVTRSLSPQECVLFDVDPCPVSQVEAED